jgi:hypothetical protein
MALWHFGATNQRRFAFISRLGIDFHVG